MAAYKCGDYATALKEWRSLAEQGDAVAQYKIGGMYDNGRGVSENDAEAVKWFHKAAEQGLVIAQINLGIMYSNGDGIPVNNIKAYMWFSLAKTQGHKDASGKVDFIKKRMTPTQIAKAQALATEWWEEHNN